MNTFKTITLALMLIIFSVTGLRAEEMSLKPFTNEFFTALQAQDGEKIWQLLIDSPNTAKLFQQRLTILGKETGENAEKSRALAELVGQLRQALSDDNDSRSALTRLQEAGENAYYIGDYPTALEKWHNGLKKAQEQGNKTYISQFLGNLGVVYKNLGQYPKALEYYQQALAMDKALGDKRGEGADLGNIGVLYQNLGQYLNALESFQQALAIHQELGDKSDIGNDLTNIGVVYDNLGQYNHALEYYQQALAIDKALGDKRGEAADLGNIGAVYQKLGQYLKALEYYQQALAIDQKIGDKSGIGANLTNIGVVYDNFGQYNQALDYLKQALAIDKELGDKRGEGADLGNIGAVYQKLGQYLKALEYYQQALAIDQKIGDKSGIAADLTNIGVVYNDLGQYLNALEYYQQALAIKKEIGDKSGIGADLTNIGVVYRHLGQYNQALEYFQQALAIDQKIGDKRGEGADLGNIGVVYDDLGQYQKALEYYQQALAIDQKIDDKRGEGADLTNIGLVYRNVGQYSKALKYFQQALAIEKKIGDKRGIGADLTNIGVVYDDLGQYQKALEYYQQALTIHQELGDKRGIGADLTNLGVVYQKLGQYLNALEYFKSALAIKKELGDKRGVGDTINNIGALYKNLGEYQKAKEAFQESMAIMIAIGTGETWTAQRGLASAEAKLNQFDAAVKHYEQALDNIEKLRAGLAEKEQKLSFMRGKMFVYDQLIKLLQTLHQKQPTKGYDRKALEIFERKQGRVFLEEMGQSGARLFTGLPKEISEREPFLENQLAQTRQQLADERSKPTAGIKGEVVQNKDFIKTLKQRQQQLQSKLDALRETIRTEYPDYYALKYPKPVQLNQLQKKVLKAGELLLVYGVMKDSTSLWVISQQTFQAFDLPLTEESLNKQVGDIRLGIDNQLDTRSMIRTDIKNPLSRKKLSHLTYKLYTSLVPKSVRALVAKAETLYIVPTRVLYALPFEMLVTQPVKRKTDTIHYLIEEVPVAYLSSASLLKILRDAKKRRTTTARYPLLAFANPVYQGSDFRSLPNTADEARKIAKLLKSPPDSKPLQLGEKASVQQVFDFNQEQRLDDYRYLLFATHGIIPGKSNIIKQPALVLSQPNLEADKGLLKMADVFALELNAQLVSLSACNTGSGKQERGEGVMGLTRAFMYAGTPVIAVTLWSVNTYSTEQLNVGFFDKLTKIPNPAKALQAIKLEMLHGTNGKKYQHPYYWAPFVLFGDTMGRKNNDAQKKSISKKKQDRCLSDNIMVKAPHLVAALLAEMGYYFANEINNPNPQAVKNALMAFQRDIGVPQTGQLDNNTWQRLRKVRLSSNRKTLLSSSHLPLLSCLEN